MKAGVRVVISDPTCEEFFPSETIDVQETLQNYVIEMGENIKQINKFQEEYTYNLNEPKIENALLYGMIYSSKIGDVDGKFTLEKSILSLPMHFNRKFVQLRFKEKQLGLCRGQIIAVSGVYDKGILYVSNIYTNCRKKIPEKLPETFNSSIVICCGPYVTNNIDSVIKLNERISRLNPDFTIFLGPFVTEDCFLVSNSSKDGPAYFVDNLTEEIVQILSHNLSNSVFIPSPEDATGLQVIPSPRIMDGGLTYSCTGNPCQIRYGPLEMYAIAFQSMQYLENNCDGNEVEKGIMAKQCNGYPSVADCLMLNNISEMKAKRSPHFYIYAGNQEISEWEGTTSMGIPSYAKANKFALLVFKDGNFEIQFL